MHAWGLYDKMKRRRHLLKLVIANQMTNGPPRGGGGTQFAPPAKIAPKFATHFSARTSFNEHSGNLMAFNSEPF
jgi:hypothetical protein